MLPEKTLSPLVRGGDRIRSEKLKRWISRNRAMPLQHRPGFKPTV